MKVKKKRSDNSERWNQDHLSQARFIKFLLRKGLPTDDNLILFFTGLYICQGQLIMGSNFNNRKFIILLRFLFLPISQVALWPQISILTTFWVFNSKETCFSPSIQSLASAHCLWEPHFQSVIIGCFSKLLNSFKINYFYKIKVVKIIYFFIWEMRF